nr:transposase zinc-binding domain-containing protein [Bacillus thuringiensis]
MEANILKRIFFDKHSHWERFKGKYGARIRPVVLKEIEKFRGCGDPENGFKLFVCEGCHHVRKVPYRCKGRFWGFLPNPSKRYISSVDSLKSKI